MYKTYYKLKKMSRKDIYDIGVRDKSISQDDINIVNKYGIEYFTKGTLLEMLSVNHREWDKKAV